MINYFISYNYYYENVRLIMPLYVVNYQLIHVVIPVMIYGQYAKKLINW